MPTPVEIRVGLHRGPGTPGFSPFGGSLGPFPGFGSGGSGPPGGAPAGEVAGADTIGYRPAPLSEGPPTSLHGAASERWVRRIVDTVNRSLSGKLNVTLSVTLTANAASTVITDARISAFSALMFAPLTANAATEQAAGGLYVSAQQSGQATIQHANNAQADRRFRVVILS